MVDIKNGDLNKDQKAILKHLAEYKEANQSELNKVTDREYSRTLYYIQKLQNDYLIYLYKEVPGRGQPAKIWRPTMKGLLLTIYENPHLLDNIARNNQHIWIFFREWQFILFNKEIRDKLADSIKEFTEKNNINKNAYYDPLSVHYLPRTLSLHILLHTMSPVYSGHELKYYLENSVLKQYIKLLTSQTKEDYLRKLIEIQIIQNLIKEPNKKNIDLKKLYHEIIENEELVETYTKNMFTKII